MSRILRISVLILGVLASSRVRADVLVFKDGSRMSVGRYELRGPIVVFAEKEGPLHSLPVEYLDLEETERLNRPPTASPQVVVVESSPSSEPSMLLPAEKAASSPGPAAANAGIGELEGGDKPDAGEIPPGEAMSLLGVVDLVEEIPGEASFQTEQLTARWPVDDAAIAFFRSNARRAFEPDSLRPVVSEAFERRAPQPSLRTGSTFLRSSLWQKLRELEQAGSGPEAARDFREFERRLQTEPPTREQLEIAERIDEALRLSRLQVELRMGILEALVDGYRRLAPVGLTDAALASWLAQTRRNLSTNARLASVTYVLYRYGSLEEVELSESLEFWESEAGRGLRVAAEESLLEGVRVAAARLNLLLAEEGRRRTRLALRRGRAVPGT